MARFVALLMGAWLSSASPAADVVPDIEAGLAAGDKLLAALPEIREGFSSIAYFEAVLEDKTVGYSQLSIRAAKSDAGLRYEYNHDAFVTLPSGMQVTAGVHATLTRRFSPLSIRAERTVANPAGEKMSVVQTATVESDDVLLTTSAGDRQASRTVPRPPGQLVFGLDCLVQLLDFTGAPIFVLREFDFQDGTAVNQTFKAAKNADGTTRVEVKSEGSQLVGQFFVLDETQALSSFGEPPFPGIEKRVTRERFDAVKRSLGAAE